MESYFRMFHRMILSTTKWQTRHFLKPQKPSGFKWLTVILQHPSSLIKLLQRSSYFSLSCYFPSFPVKSGYFPICHNFNLRLTYFQNRHSRSGPFGSSGRVLSKNKDNIQEIIDSEWKKVEKIARLLDCPDSKVIQMISKDTRIVTTFSFAKVEAIIRLLRGYGFSADSIVRYQSVFCWNIQTLTHRIEGLLPYRKYQFSLVSVIYSKRNYEMHVSMLADEVKVMGSHPTRLSFLADILKCDEKEVNEAIALGHRHLETHKLSKLKSIIDLLVKHGFSYQEIMSNLQVLQMDQSVFEYRLTQMADTGVFEKNKMLQALAQSNRQYKIMFNLHVSNAAALKEHDDKFSYLQSRLACSEDDIVALLTRAPTIKNVTPRRLNEILDILLNEFCFPPSILLTNYHLLFFSAKRLRKRWELLSNLPLSLEEMAADLIITEEKFEKKYLKNEKK